MTQLHFHGAVLAMFWLATIPATGQDNWQLQHPWVLATFEPVQSEEQFRQAIPVGFCWANDRPVFGVKLADGENIQLHLYAEAQRGEWKLLTTLNNLIGTPRLISLGRDIGLVSAMRGTTKQTAASVLFYRLSPTGDILLKQELISLPGATGSWHVVAAEVSGSRLAVLAEHHPTNRESEKQLHFVQSLDLGRRWEASNRVGISQYPGFTMPCIPTLISPPADISFYQWELAKLGEQIKVFRQASSDGGSSWKRSPVSLQDNLGANAFRVPLFAHQQPDHSLLVYATISNQDGNSGRFYLTRSTDQGQSWQPGQPLTNSVKLDESSLHIQLASHTASSTSPAFSAFSYSSILETEGTEIEQGQFIVSHSAEKNWQAPDLDSFYHGYRLHPVVTISPSGDRLLFGSSVCIHPKFDRRNFWVVQEFSPRSPATRTLFNPSQQTQVSRWLRDLSDDQFDLRQSATQRLIDLGPSARSLLLDALHSTHDPEVRRRLTLILAKVYPPCLKVR